MRTRFLKAAVGIGGALLTVAAVTPAAHAADPTPAGVNQGYDNEVQRIFGGGSDTTYETMQRLEVLYNGSPGCAINVTATACAGEGLTKTENYDHDVLVGEYPTGSGNGVTKLTSGADPSFRYARASSNRSASVSTVTYSGYAKDGLAIVAFSGAGYNSTVRKISKADAASIFYGPTCKTNWDQITNPDTGTPYPSKPIRPYGIQSGSGTYSALRTALGLPGSADPNACSIALENECIANNDVTPGPLQIQGAAANSDAKCERQLFENNTAPIDGGQGAGTDGNLYTGPATDRADAVWWMANGVRVSDPKATGTASVFPILNNQGTYQLPTATTIGALPTAANSYALTRVLWHVSLRNDLDDTTGNGGAARAFHEWLCRNTNPVTGAANAGSHAQNPKIYYTEISNVITATGFVRIGLGESSKLDGPDGAAGNADDIQTRCQLDNFLELDTWADNNAAVPGEQL